MLRMFERGGSPRQRERGGCALAGFVCTMAICDVY